MFNDWKINYLYLYLYLYLYSNKKLPIQYKKVGTGTILNKKIKMCGKEPKDLPLFWFQRIFQQNKVLIQNCNMYRYQRGVHIRTMICRIAGV